MAGDGVMSRPTLKDHVDAYIADKRARGYVMTSQRYVLHGFARFAEREGTSGPLTLDLARRWAESVKSARVGAAEERLRILRPFARHLADEEPGTEVPPFRMLGPAIAPEHVHVPRDDVCTELADRVCDYVALRRSLGHAFVTQELLLRTFARYARDTGHKGPVTIACAVSWAKATTSPDPAHAGRRLGALRGFLRYLAGFEPRSEVPPAGLLGPPTRRKPPHIYSDAEIAALLKGARALRVRGGLRPWTYATFFSLLASTGLRVGEARDLRCADVDLKRRLLTVRDGKFHKSRLVPLHPTAIQPLRGYTKWRDRHRAGTSSAFFFRTDRSDRLGCHAVELTFMRLRDRLGWTEAGRTRVPRMQDLRHTFAVRRIQRWYEDGENVDLRLPQLATYMGHVDISGTYWYLTAVPELMALCADRFERSTRAARERRT